MIHHVQLSAPSGSEPSARAFWSGVLGLEEVEKPIALAARGGCWFRGHGIEIHVGIEDGFAPARRAHPGFRVDGIDDWATRLEGAGHPVAWDDLVPGMRRFYTADPFGNRLEFLEPSDAGGGRAAGRLGRP
jgi:catechol 2,3-dioxygenase-like lactoylglutathione lyase family enzyme